MRSCNPVFYEISLKLYNDTDGALSQMARAFGFGAPTGIIGIGEEEGLVPDAAWKNVNTASVFEPGSTFKPFAVAWALQKQVIRREEVFFCENGKYRMGRRLLRDHHPYGNLSVKDVLVKSSNIGMAKIGERLTNAGLFAAAVRFGFGRKTGSGLPGEVAGLLRPLKEWTDYKDLPTPNKERFRDWFKRHKAQQGGSK